MFYTVKNMQQAWKKVNEIFPTDYQKDDGSSERAGYPVYRSTAEGHYYDYICDLDDRLEVNLSTGETINVWVKPESVEDEPAERPSKEDIKAAASNKFVFEPEKCLRICFHVCGYKFENNAERRVYRAMRSMDDWERNFLAGDLCDAYCKDKGIAWGYIMNVRCTDYTKEGADEGHYFIEAFVKERRVG